MTKLGKAALSQTARFAAMAAALVLLQLPDVFAHGDLHEQIELLTQKIARSPEDAQLYLKRAELHRMHQEVGLAEADYGQALRLDETLTAAHLGRGKLLLQSGAYEEARSELDRFLETSPNHLDGLVTRARLEVRRKRPLVAAEDYARVLRLPGKPEIEYFLEYADALAAAGPEHVTPALAVIDEGLEKLGPIPTLQLKAIDLEVSVRNFQSALARLDKASGPASRKESWLERRGDILRQAGESDQARQDYERALTMIDGLPARLRGRKATSEMELRLHEKIRASTRQP